MTPPLRPPGNSDALWRGLADGSISVLSSDHNALGRRVKESRPHFLDVPPGVPGVETLLPFAYSEGVARGRLSLERMVEVVSSAPARIYGLPRKGAIRVGHDADLVIFDPSAAYRVKAKNLASPAGFSIFEDCDFQGKVKHTILRGEVIVADGQFVGRKGYGRFIARTLHREQFARIGPRPVAVTPQP
jgi:dihydropyrimidinase